VSRKKESMSNDEATTVSNGNEKSELGDRRFPRSYFMPKPVKIDETIDVEITEESKKGDGMTRIKGYIIFVPNTKKGDKVKIKITQIRPNHAIGEIE
jgi:predicted RNA-binding protein with TRAM domain